MDDSPALHEHVRSLYLSGPGTAIEPSSDSADSDSLEESEDEGGEEAAAAPIPPGTFIEEIALRAGVHPFSAFSLVDELRREGTTCLTVERERLLTSISAITLRLLGHQWPRDSEDGQAAGQRAIDDGVIPIIESPSGESLLARLSDRLIEERPSTSLGAQQAEFSQVVGESLPSWLESNFFTQHTTQFRRRPIAWQIQSARFAKEQKPAFAALLYYHALSRTFLPGLRSKYIGPLILRLEIEQRDLERTPRDARNADQNDRLARLQDSVLELRSLDGALERLIRDGFAPDKQKHRLRELAIDDALLSLTRAFLKRLSRDVADGPLAKWQRAAADTRLHSDFGMWIADALNNLSVHCSRVKPESPSLSSQADDPTCDELSRTVIDRATGIVSEALHYACTAWWSRFHDAVLAPLDAQMRQLRVEITALATADLTAAERRARKRDFSDRIKALKQERLVRVTKASVVRKSIEDWSCPVAASWVDWLSGQPMFDEFASPDGRRSVPTSIAVFVTQEGAYEPDINDGVRVNIAPLQKAGVLAAPVLAPADADKAIAERAEWRADERRWCREGRLPQPGWWSPREADER